MKKPKQYPQNPSHGGEVETAELSSSPYALYSKEARRYSPLTRNDEEVLFAKLRGAEELVELIETLQYLGLGEEEERISKHYLQQIKGVRRRLFGSNIPFAISRIALYSHRSSMEIKELIQLGMAGLNRAIDTFDHTMGFKFSTHAAFPIDFLMERGVANTGKTIRIPVGVGKNINTIKKLRKKFKAEVGEDFTEEELIRHAKKELELTRGQVKKLLEAESIYVESFDTSGSPDASPASNEDSKRPSFEPSKRNKKYSPELLCRTASRNHLLTEFLAKLDEDERLVIEGFFFHKIPLNIVGDLRGLKVKKRQARFIKKKALDKLRSYMTSHGIEPTDLILAFEIPDTYIELDLHHAGQCAELLSEKLKQKDAALKKETIEALYKAGGNTSLAANKLRIDERGLHQIIHRLKIDLAEIQKEAKENMKWRIIELLLVDNGQVELAGVVLKIDKKEVYQRIRDHEIDFWRIRSETREARNEAFGPEIALGDEKEKEEMIRALRQHNGCVQNVAKDLVFTQHNGEDIEEHLREALIRKALIAIYRKIKKGDIDLLLIRGGSRAPNEGLSFTDQLAERKTLEASIVASADSE